MFKQLVLASAVLAASSGIALADHSYKGERDYKGEVAPSCPTCATYAFMSGPYIGASVGVRNNYSGAPAVYKGLEGILSLGYAGVLTPSFYLPAEIIGANSLQLRNYRDPDGDGIRTTWNYGISLIPGVMITDYIMGYVRVGAQRARFTNIGEHKCGWHVGLGGQGNIAPNWDIRGEYVYSSYHRTSELGRPRADQFNVGVVFKFM